MSIVLRNGTDFRWQGVHNPRKVEHPAPGASTALVGVDVCSENGRLVPWKGYSNPLVTISTPPANKVPLGQIRALIGGQRSWIPLKMGSLLAQKVNLVLGGRIGSYGRIFYRYRSGTSPGRGYKEPTTSPAASLRHRQTSFQG